MPYTQENRLLKLTTPLGEDKLLIRSIDGMEGISQLYTFRVDAFAPNDFDVDFSKLIGQPVCVRVILDKGEANSNQRYYHGLVQTVTRGPRGTANTAYILTVVPRLWNLTRTTDSRIFQQLPVPDILKKVLSGIDVKWEIQGTWEPRDFVVQYRESDFDFASRLMEEEGIFYYFRHAHDGHQMIVGNTPQSHQDLPSATELYYDDTTGGMDDIEIIYGWEKSQTLRSGKTTLRDYNFELPDKGLETETKGLETVAVGTVTHKLKVGGNDNMDLYDFPGGYAGRFDGINKSGGEQASNLQKIFEDNKRTSGIRMQQEVVNAISITAHTAYLEINSGYKFQLKRHYADDDTYVITRSHFSIPQRGGYEAEGEIDVPPAEIVFNCIPLALPFRPQRVTPKPQISSTQTAHVVGPAGEEICTDKYGRIKVQFLWERDQKRDTDASCWVRVAQQWAGKNFGIISIPRIGQEVIVAFEEGDPDQPIVVGSVYNAHMMPPYTLPEEKTKSTFMSRSSLGGGGFNELRFEDKKDSEQVFIHAQKNMDLRVLNDRMEWIGNDSHLIVTRDYVTHVKRDVHRTIDQDLVEKVGRDVKQEVTGKQAVKIGNTATWEIGSNAGFKVSGNTSIETTGDTLIKGTGKIVVESTAQVTLKVGGNFVDVGPSGVTIVGTMVKINSGGAAGSAQPVSMLAVSAPLAAVEADNGVPGGHQEYAKSGSARADDEPPATASQTTGSSTPPPQPQPEPQAPTHNPSAPENQDKTNWIGIRLKDRTGKAIPNRPYKIVLPGGEEVTGTLDDKGEAKVEKIDPGTCKVYFPGLADWQKA